jgi:ribosomal protein S18 acetylase RimI-like enzyme
MKGGPSVDGGAPVGGLAIRRAGPDDVPTVVRLVNLAYRVEAFFVDGDRTDAAEIALLLERGAFLIAERDGGAVGSVLVEDRRDHGYIGLLSVDPALQRGGIGRALMEAAEALLRDAGRPRVELQVVDLRAELPPWYRALGYREVGVRPFPPGERVKRACHFIVMSKRLPPDRASSPPPAASARGSGAAPD